MNGLDEIETIQHLTYFEVIIPLSLPTTQQKLQSIQREMLHAAFQSTRQSTASLKQTRMDDHSQLGEF